MELETVAANGVSAEGFVVKALKDNTNGGKFSLATPKDPIRIVPVYRASALFYISHFGRSCFPRRPELSLHFLLSATATSTRTQVSRRNRATLSRH